MSAPKFAPLSSPDDVRTYGSPDHVPEAWMPDRPAEIHGRQPEGGRLGYQGPDQGYVLNLAKFVKDKIVVATGESVEDAMRGSINIALRRASLFGRAPVIHDLTIAVTIWGWLDASPAAELVTRRRQLFEGVGNTNHHYTEGRMIADLVPEATLRMTPAAAAAAYAAGQWRTLTGA
jgi:hypothetical protein